MVNCSCSRRGGNGGKGNEGGVSFLLFRNIFFSFLLLYYLPVALTLASREYKGYEGGIKIAKTHLRTYDKLPKKEELN